MEIRPTSYAELVYLSTIRLLSHKATGPEAGSAFAVDDGCGRAFLVTAGHVVKDATAVTMHFYSGKQGPDLGPPLSFETRQPQGFWHCHPDCGIDVAVAPLGPIQDFFETDGQAFYLPTIPFKYFFSEWVQFPPSPFDGFRRPRALEEVLIVGYPNDYRDRPTSLPLLRRGVIATPLWLDHEGRPVFLVDTAASHGTSGGPVLYVEEKQQAGNTMYGDTGRVALLGVFSETLPPKATTAQPDSDVRPPNVGAAYKAKCILDVIASLEPTKTARS